MPRQMSFKLTQHQMRNRTKSVTRRVGWAFLKEGDLISAVVQGQGLKLNESPVRIGMIRIIGCRAELLSRVVDDPEYGKSEMVLEGFPGMKPEDFVVMLEATNKDANVSIINRIEFEFVEEAVDV